MPTTGHLQAGSTTVPYALDLPPSGGAGAAAGATAVCLLHGASGKHDSLHLPILAATCAAAGLPCLRFTCRGGNLLHRINVCKAVLEQAVRTVPGLDHTRRWVLVGHSMGARVACQVATDTPQQVAACILLSYPLHPPGKPAELRDALLVGVEQPVLLVRGSRDPFSQQDQWDVTLGRLRSRSWRLRTMEGGNHSLTIGANEGSSKSQEALQGICSEVQRFLLEMLQPEQLQQGPGVAAPAAAPSSRDDGQPPAGTKKRKQPKATAMADKKQQQQPPSKRRR